ncbi:MAG: STAS/SEC14 domain-containing protein [Chloroflexota bacterium]|nr:STAS/SEC14 domain-containing protein [Chloroflexota bacterium]
MGPRLSTAEVTRAERPQFWEPLTSDGIARIRYEAGDIVAEDLARATIVELKALTSGKRLPVLVDIRKMKSVTREARVVFGNAADAFSALALLAGSPRTQLIANFFIGLSRPKVPTQMFTDEEKALTWLRRHAV